MAFGTVPGFKEAMIRQFIRHVGGFRPATVRAWPKPQFARQVVQRELEGTDDAVELLKIYYIYVAPDIQSRFLSLTGVPADGSAVSEAAKPPYATRDKVLAAVLPLASEFGMSALHYLRSLQVVIPAGWPGIGEAIEQFHNLRASAAEQALGGVTTESEPVPDLSRAAAPLPAALAPTRLKPPSGAHLGVLDDLVVLAVINCANHMDGAISPEEAKRLVAELVRVNGQRHQSWYAAGLYRSLFDDSDCDPGTKEAPGAREWFAAGRVVGLMRRGLAEEVIALFDADTTWQQLGKTGTGASHEAAPHIFGALWAAERFEDATAFLTPDAVSKSSRIAVRAFDAGTEMLAQRRFVAVRGVFDLLREGLAIREMNGTQVEPSIVRLIERRQAHIRRMAGEFDAARQLLRPIIDAQDEAPELRSMLLTDIALMDAGFRELADLRIPSDRTEVNAIAVRLADQEATLEDAIDLASESGGAAHAHYVLGMLALLQERGGHAEKQLGHAISAFRSEPTVYTRQGLLSQATIHHALAVCLAGGAAGEVVEAARTMLMSTTEELRIPDWMLDSVLTSVAAADRVIAEELFEALVDQRGDDVISTLEGLADTIGPVAHAFLARSKNASLSAARRVDAARVALNGLLKHDDLDGADDAFAMLIDNARRGVGCDSVLTMLQSHSELTRLREADELLYVRAELHAANSEWDTAVGLLTTVAEGMLASAEPWRRAEAASVIERLRGIPEADSITATLSERLRRAEAEIAPPSPSQAHRRLRLLVVGGHEMQVQYESEILAILRRDASHIDVDFVPTGWSSNWGKLADKVVAEMERCDGMVLHYFVRTMFGRRVRAAAPIWCSVAGHGRDGILRGIYRCAEMVQRGTR